MTVKINSSSSDSVCCAHKMFYQVFSTLDNVLIQNIIKTSSWTKWHTVRHYAKPATGGIPSLGKKVGKGKVGPTLEKKVLPVETDAKKLVSHLCGSNVFKTGEDIKLKEDHEYPEWLWELNTGKPPPLEELDPDTYYYWYRLRKLSNRRSTRLLKLKKF